MGRFVVAAPVSGAVVSSKAAGTAASTPAVTTICYPCLEPKDPDCAAKLKKRTLTNLYNERPTWLDLVHKKLDAAAYAAYGWPADLSDEQVLERLLKLNLERAAEEAKSVQTKKPKTSRTKRENKMLWQESRLRDLGAFRGEFVPTPVTMEVSKRC